MIRTQEFVTESFLRDFYEIDEDDPVEKRIDTHDGSWVREGILWRWWEAE